ncbi:MAG: Nramp family divalent metal transporter [Planctomycetaceae bacterium]
MPEAPSDVKSSASPDEAESFRLPPRGLGPMLAAIGPGIVVTGSVIGSGELINTPVQAARFGFVLLWAVIISCVIKCFLQIEIGRHALVHNRTPFESFNALPGWKWRGTSWIGPVFVLGSVLTAASLAGILRATGRLLHSFVPLLEYGRTLGRFVDNRRLFRNSRACFWRGLMSASKKSSHRTGGCVQPERRRGPGADPGDRVSHQQ